MNDLTDLEWRAIKKYSGSINRASAVMGVISLLWLLISYMLFKNKDYVPSLIFLILVLFVYYILFKSLVIVNRDTLKYSRECVTHKRRMPHSMGVNSRYLVITDAGNKCVTNEYNYERIANGDKVLIFKVFKTNYCVAIPRVQ